MTGLTEQRLRRDIVRRSSARRYLWGGRRRHQVRSAMRQRQGKGRRKTTRPDKVIHVLFGPGGGRLDRVAGVGATPGQPSAQTQQSREPITDLFTRGEIARLLRTTPTRLRTLDRAGVVSPSGRRRGRRAYTFADVIQL